MSSSGTGPGIADCLKERRYITSRQNNWCPIQMEKTCSKTQKPITFLHKKGSRDLDGLKVRCLAL